LGTGRGYEHRIFRAGERGNFVDRTVRARFPWFVNVVLLLSRVFAFSHEMFVHANEHRDLFRAMVGKRSGAMIQQVLHKMLVDLVRDDVKAMVRPDDGSSTPSEALVQFIGGGLFGLLMWWLDGKMRIGVEDVNALFRRLAIPAVKAAATAKTALLARE